MHKIITTAFCLFYFILPGFGQQKSTAPVTGTYEMGVQLCYNPATGEISGIISFDNSDNGNGASISCDQYFTGYHKRSDHIGEFSIQSKYPDDTTKETLTAGKLKIQKASVYIQLDEPNSCQNLVDLKHGWDFDLEKRDEFIACRIIKISKAYFYSVPDNSARQKSYVVKNDPVLIRSVKDGWLNVTYKNAKGVTKTGWIKQETIRVGASL
jgi:hypothetical protein